MYLTYIQLSHNPQSSLAWLNIALTNGDARLKQRCFNVVPTLCNVVSTLCNVVSTSGVVSTLCNVENPTIQRFLSYSGPKYSISYASAESTTGQSANPSFQKPLSPPPTSQILFFLIYPQPDWTPVLKIYPNKHTGPYTFPEFSLNPCNSTSRS